MSNSLRDDLAGYHVYRDPGQDGERVAVLARIAIKIAQRSGVPGLPAASVAFDVPFAGGVVHALALHTVSPLTSGRTRARNTELAAATSWAAHRSGSVVVLGDLNAVPWSAAFRDLEHHAHLELERRLRASADLAGGRGLSRSPDRSAPLLRRSDRDAPSDSRRFGSSHRSLWIELARAQNR